jgi:signal-transduction protein with cAMP-binding, CBS, and nucleotidyltransferase domain
MQVSEMYVEYFPPQADILLEKEASTDCYIIVSGAVVSRVSSYHLLFRHSNYHRSNCSLFNSVRTC